MRKTTLPAAIAAALILTGCVPATPAPNTPASSPATHPSSTATTGATGAKGASAAQTDTEGRIVTTQSVLKCRPISDRERVWVKETVGAAIDIEPGGLAVVALVDTGRRVRVLLFDTDSHLGNFAPVSDLWDGVGYGVHLTNHAEVVAQVKKCATTSAGN